MKKLFNLLLLCATVGFLFTACSKDDDESISKEQIVGTWEGTAIYVDGTWIDITKYPYNAEFGFSITFYNDGSYYGQGAFGTGHGTYAINGMTIKTYVSGDLYLTYKIKSMTDTTAEITIIEGADTLDVRVRKTNE